MATAEGKIDDQGGDKGSSFAQERAASSQTGGAVTEGQDTNIPFARAFREIAKWLNNRLASANKPTIALGTKTATVIMLRDDGALVVDVDGEDVKGERQYVALEAAHLDALMPQLKL